MDKPKIGEKCNGCGVCCRAHVCGNGSYILGLVKNFGDKAEGPCPAIVKMLDGTIRCGIVLNPKKYIKNRNNYKAAALSRNFATLIGSDTGCDELCDIDTQSEEDHLIAMLESHKKDPEWRKKVDRALEVIYGI